MKRLFWKALARLCGLIVALKLEEARHAPNLDAWRAPAWRPCAGTTARATAGAAPRAAPR